MVFRAGLCDPCTRDVASLSESVKILEQASIFTLADSRSTSQVHGSLIGKPFGNCFIK
jgi:hypothetical protein